MSDDLMPNMGRRFIPMATETKDRYWYRQGKEDQYQMDTDRIEAQAAEIERLEKAIKIQASAVRTLQANEDTEINILRKQKREWHQAVSSLDSEREANAILTAEIERLRVAGTNLSTYAAHDDGCASVQRWQTDQCNCGYIDALRQWSAALEGKAEQ